MRVHTNSYIYIYMPEVWWSIKVSYIQIKVLNKKHLVSFDRKEEIILKINFDLI